MKLKLTQPAVALRRPVDFANVRDLKSLLEFPPNLPAQPRPDEFLHSMLTLLSSYGLPEQIPANLSNVLNYLQQRKEHTVSMFAFFVTKIHGFALNWNSNFPANFPSTFLKTSLTVT
jgi:hypothetical protein